MQLKDKKFASRGMKILPLEFQKVDPLPEWWFLVPDVDDKDCVQSNPIATININVKRQSGYYVRVGFCMLGSVPPSCDVTERVVQLECGHGARCQTEQ